MNKDDIVTVHDFSWSKWLTVHKYCKNDCTRKYTVIEINCTFPRNKFDNPPFKYRTNTIIRAIDGDNEVRLIHAGFLRPVVKPIREVTMSEVCAQFGEEVKVKRD